MKLLSRAEEIILLTILKLKDNAYGVTIRQMIKDDTGDWWSFGSIYTPLNKLTRKQYVKKEMGEPTTERGGRSKCLYRITEDGMQALAKIHRVQENTWSGVSKAVFKKND